MQCIVDDRRPVHSKRARFGAQVAGFVFVRGQTTQFVITFNYAEKTVSRLFCFFFFPAAATMSLVRFSNMIMIVNYDE